MNFYSVCKYLFPIQIPYATALYIFITSVLQFKLIKFCKLDLPNPDKFWQILISEKSRLLHYVPMVPSSDDI